MTHVVAGMAESPRGFEGRLHAAASAVRASGVHRFHIAFLAMILGYGVSSAGGRNFIDWTICLLSIGLVSLVFWLGTNRRDAAPIEPWLVWAVVLPPAYVAWQLVPFPMEVLRVISPARAELAGMLGTVMTPPAFAALSINPAVTLSYLLNIIGYTLTFLLVLDIASRLPLRQRWLIVLPLTIVAVAEAGLGLVQSTDGSVALGTYRNRNHLAGLLEMALPMTVACGVALLLQRNAMRRGVPMVRTLAAVLVFVAAGLVLAGLIVTSSKMGFIAAVCGLFTMGTLAVFTTFRGARRWAGVAGLGVVCLAVFVVLPTDQFVSSFGEIFSGTTDTSEGRWPVAHDATHLLGSYPLFGSGFGTFGTAFLKHQTALTELDFTFAHNDYLELATEAGGAGFLIFAGLMLAVLVRAVRAGADDHDWNTRALGLGCSGAIVAIAVHSWSDFNMYIPANPMVLAWISGMAVSLPARSFPPDEDLPPNGPRGLLVSSRRSFTGRAPLANRAVLQKSVVVLAGVLVVYAGGRLVLERAFRGNFQAERVFCRIGICDIDEVLAAQGQEPSGAVAPDTIPALTDTLRKDAAAPYRWCDLGEAMVKAGRVEEARKCFSTALALGPNIPPIMLRVAFSGYDLGEQKRAMALTSRVLDETTIYDSTVFNWYRVKKMPVTDILDSGLPGRGERASRGYLRYLMSTGNFDDAAVVWNWSLGRRYADADLAREYVSFLYGNRRYETAARSWAGYLGDSRDGYLDSNRVFNGGFESEPSRTAFDWRLDRVDEVAVALDPNVARSGKQSLKIQFDGRENVDYNSTSQTVFVTPGAYRFQAFVRAAGITTNQGIRFRVSGEGVGVTTDQVAGTSDWTRVEQTVRVDGKAKLLTVQVVRQRSLKFDSHIAGTAWVDDVSLSRIE